MKRFTDDTVFSGLVTAWFLAALPTTRSPSLRKPSTDGVVRSPSALTRISGSLPSMTAIAEFVVPRSIPRILAISCFLSVGVPGLERRIAPAPKGGGPCRALCACTAQTVFNDWNYII